VIQALKEAGRGKNLLIVEDDSAASESLKRLLGHFFESVMCASTLKTAFESYALLASRDDPCIIISDIHLGEENGIDLIRHIKHDNPRQKVIAISGTEERDIFIESIRYGVDRFVLKPIDQNDLFGALITVLQQVDYDRELEASRTMLEDSKEYALGLLEEQDQFLKNAIHEIHTPLSVIIMNIDLLRLDGIDNSYLSAIEAGSRIIQNSYEDMTYLMKKDRIDPVRATIDLVEFLRERVDYFTCIAEVNELSFSLRIGEPDLPRIHFSELKLSRLIDNTLSNAIKYSYRPGEIEVSVGMRHNRLFFEVRNHGPLIQDKQKIFHRFHRESDHKGGYGLGLSIVAQICEEENVEIVLSSTPVRGTSFRYIFENATLLQHNSSTIALSNHRGGRR
jgi:two-component system, sensor histidine kinase and response regulator